MHTLPPLGSSDHSLVSFKLLLSIQHPHTPPDDYSRPNFAKADWIGICSYLDAINWHSVDCNSVEQYWDVFYSVISVAIDTYVLFSITQDIPCHLNCIPRMSASYIAEEKELLYRSSIGTLNRRIA